ncbi:MAG: hypothetical protein OXE54_04590 [Gammaproteobacteria bacterium]|nr:hypothetical protein [Gammaproteobacteria bacterium]
MKIHRDETPVCGYQRMVCSTRSIQTSAGIAVESEIVRRDFGCRDESVVFLLDDPDFIVLHRPRIRSAARKEILEQCKTMSRIWQ